MPTLEVLKILKQHPQDPEKHPTHQTSKRPTDNNQAKVATHPLACAVISQTSTQLNIWQLQCDWIHNALKQAEITYHQRKKQYFYLNERYQIKKLT